MAERLQGLDGEADNPVDKRSCAPSGAPRAGRGPNGRRRGGAFYESTGSSILTRNPPVGTFRALIVPPWD